LLPDSAPNLIQEGITRLTEQAKGTDAGYGHAAGAMRIRDLCVSIHDVSPSTWPQCETLLKAIHEVADIPVTLLVVPAYHHLAVGDSTDYEGLLLNRLQAGDELALHGYTHLDEGSAPTGWRDWYARRIYTQCEGEFSVLGCAEAKQRLQWGLEWFAERGWPVQGFVAPAWLLGEGAWQALRESSFDYTTTISRFYFLPQRRSLFAPSLVYSARSRWGSALSRVGNSVSAQAMRGAPLVRLGLHPADVRHPATLRHMQRLLANLLATRAARTKAAFARRWCGVPDEGQKSAFKGVPIGAR
jgi:predicted deacetylase